MKQTLNVTCSNCGVPLAAIWIKDPSLDVRFSFIADCDHCGDHSYLTVVDGSISILDTEYTSILDYHDENGITHIKTKKVKDYVAKQ